MIFEISVASPSLDEPIDAFLLAIFIDFESQTTGLFKGCFNELGYALSKNVPILFFEDDFGDHVHDACVFLKPRRQLSPLRRHAARGAVFFLAANRRARGRDR